MIIGLLQKILSKPKKKMMTLNKKPVISIIGTTGVGKSQLSIELASRCNGEVINADSMQMYKNLDIITNKHPIKERYGIPHHVMNHVDWDDEYDMHRFKRDALTAIEDIHKRGKLPIIVGGTHYYLQSLLFTNKSVVTNQDESMLGVKKEDETKGLTDEQVAILDGPEDELILQLREIDPDMANKFHPNDHRRIKRSLEIFFKTGEKASDIYKSQRRLEESSLRFKTLFLWVWSDQEVLNKRLDDRVDQMLQTGGMDEIKELYQIYKNHSPTPDCERGVWQVIGFKEFLPWLQSNEQLSKCVEDMKVRTRRYSKRQVKWIKNSLCDSLSQEVEYNNGDIFLLDATDLNKWIDNVNKRGVEICQSFLNNNNNLKEIPVTPIGLESMITRDIDKTAVVVEQKHYHCEVCKDQEGNPLVILSGQWQAHLNGSKHKSVLKRGKRKRDYEEWLKNKKS